jgi:hypothetical protein
MRAIQPPFSCPDSSWRMAPATPPAAPPESADPARMSHHCSPGAANRLLHATPAGPATREMVAIRVRYTPIAGCTVAIREPRNGSPPLREQRPRRGSPDSGRIAYQSTFAPWDGWQADFGDPAFSVSFGGGYKVTGAKPIVMPILVPQDDPSQALSVLIAAKSYPRSGTGFGIECAAGGGGFPARYQLIVLPSGRWFIERREAGNPDGGVLLTSQAAPLAASATAQFICATVSVNKGTGSNRLVAFIDGKRVADLMDVWSGLPAGGWQPRLLVEPIGTTPRSVTFTRCVVRHIPD